MNVKLGFRTSFIVIKKAEEVRQATDLGEEKGELEAADKDKTV